MARGTTIGLWLAVIAICGTVPRGTAVERTWNGPATGDWFTAANWLPGGAENNYPQAGDTVVIPSGKSVLLTNETAELAAFSITNATLIFSNWTTRLRATEVNIWSNGNLTHAAIDTNVALGVTNRVYLEAQNVTIHANGKINVTEQGFRGGSGSNMKGQGPGGGVGSGSYGGPAGHGGMGGTGGNTPGGMYGVIAAPETPGSGGGSGSGTAGHGGGIVRINATGTVRVEGSILANAGPGTGQWARGPGSGGSVYITCQTYQGGGLIQAFGGNGDTAAGSYMPGGGGGRIAVVYTNATAQGALVPRPRLQFHVLGGLVGSGSRTNGQMGSVYIPDDQGLAPVVPVNGYLHFATTTIEIPNSLTFSNTQTGFATNQTVRILGDMLLTNNARLYLHALPQGDPTEADGLLEVQGQLLIRTGTVIYSHSHPTLGGAYKIAAYGLEISLGGTIDASRIGLRGGIGAENGYGDGCGTYSSGYGGPAGYGGKGGGLRSGGTYGNRLTPILPGSGGGAASSQAGNGGGVVWLEVRDTLTVNGDILSNGGNGNGSWPAGPGSGGSVFITCSNFQGNTGARIQAIGGNGDVSYLGAAGGGRISIAVGLSDSERANLMAGGEVVGLTEYWVHSTYLGATSVAYGAIGKTYTVEGDKPQNGTIQFLTVQGANTYNLDIEGLPSTYGAPTPRGYGAHVGIPANSVITNSVVTPATESGGQRWSCMGWSLFDAQDNLVSHDATTTAVFTLTNDLRLVWHWTNEFYLAVSAGPYGSATGGGWFTNGFSAPISASADDGYRFAQWNGDIPLAQREDASTSLIMNQARTVAAAFTSLTGDSKTWLGGTNHWYVSDRWSPQGMPGSLDRVCIPSGTVIISGPQTMETLVVSNGAVLMFTNWTACLTASNVTIGAGATVTVANAFTTNQMSNRVWIVCTNLTVETNGSIAVDGLGYWRGNGPGRGTNAYGGAGYGGKGGDDQGYLGAGIVYGSASAPADPGSGGTNTAGGHGGGAIWLQVAGRAAVHGIVSANGLSGASGLNGGGSGGSIYLRCATLAGSTSGIMRANGGHSGGQFGYPGAGGGGRIAVIYDALEGLPGMRFSVDTGTNSWKTLDLSVPARRPAPEVGSLYFSTPALWEAVLSAWNQTPTGLNGCVYFESTNRWEWSGGALTISQSALSIPESAQWRFVGDLTIAAGRLTVGPHAQLSCGGNVRLNSGADLIIQGGMTNGAATAYGTQMTVDGELAIASNGWIYPFSHSTDGGSVFFQVGSLTVAEGGGFNADGRGYNSETGPGKGGNSYGGAGHGGRGGNDNGSLGGGLSYGVTNAPIEPGSGGKGAGFGLGGGVIWIDAAGTMTLQGTITANGLYGGNGGYGGGAGGAIYLSCAKLIGASNSLLRAAGGDAGTFFGYPGGGAGGRIAVWIGVSPERRAAFLSGQPIPSIRIQSTHETFTGILSVTNGLGWRNPPDPAAAQSGTTVFLDNPAGHGTIIRFY